VCVLLAPCSRRTLTSSRIRCNVVRIPRTSATTFLVAMTKSVVMLLIYEGTGIHRGAESA
jgi:hypothetical protein